MELMTGLGLASGASAAAAAATRIYGRSGMSGNGNVVGGGP